MKEFLFYSIISIVLYSCSANNEKPDNILEKQKLAEVLIDIHLIEARTTQARLPRDSSISYFTYLKDSIFKLHNIDSATYRQSMIYYSENIREIDLIYEIVLDSLNLKSAMQAKPVKAKAQSTKDSTSTSD
jgi:hypothetical protein